MPVKLPTCIVSPAADMTPGGISSASAQSSIFVIFGEADDAVDDFEESIDSGILAVVGGIAAFLGGLAGCLGVGLDEDALSSVWNAGR